MRETTRRTSVSSERLRSRTPVKELIYVQLSESEGGLTLNLSENGVGIRVSGTLRADFFPLSRLRLPDAENWIETSGRVAWSNKGTRAAGIEFIDLAEVSAEQIKRWMASQISGGKQPDGLPVRANGGSRGSRALSKSAATGGAAVSADLSRQRAPVTPSQVREDASAVNAASGPTSCMTRDGYVTNYSPYIPVSGAKPRRWWALIAVVGLVAAGSFLAGIALGPPGRSVPLRGGGVGVADPDAGVAASPSASPTSPTASSDSPSTANETAANTPISNAPNAKLPEDEARNAAAAPDVPATASARKTLNPNVASKHPPSSLGLEKGPLGSGKKPPQLAAEEPEVRSVDSVAAAPVPQQAGVQQTGDAGNNQQNVSNLAEANSTDSAFNGATSQNASVPASSINASAETSGPLSGTDSLQREIPSGTVTFASRFLSIKLTPELSAQPSKLTGSLQIGQLFSTTPPSYPVDAARQGVQGVVKLRATVGPDGSVQGVDVMSGPVELDAAAIKAVLGWKYGPTMLGNQPVGAAHDVTLTFELPSTSADQR